MGQHIPITLDNIAPLALKPFRPGHLALVCEGGGQRGIFTAGVLDEFMRADFNPFDLFFGSSAGAQNLSAYICNQLGYARKVIMRYTTRREFFDPLRFVRGGNLIDLDWLVNTTAIEMPLAMGYAARAFEAGKAFYMCACRQDDYSAEYFLPTHQTWLDLIRASSAIPGFYRTSVALSGVNYMDGGVSDAIPVQEAARRGADTIVVIRTVPSQMYYTPQWFKRIERWLGESSLQSLVNLVQHHEKSYLATQQFIESPPGKLRIIEIYPPKPLKSMALSSRLPALREDYKMGCLCGRYFLETVGKLLIETPPLRYTRVVAPTTHVVPPAELANDALDMPLVSVPEANNISLNIEDSA